MESSNIYGQIISQIDWYTYQAKTNIAIFTSRTIVRTKELHRFFHPFKGSSENCLDGHLLAIDTVTTLRQGGAPRQSASEQPVLCLGRSDISTGDTLSSSGQLS
jgi:hypothetical protein